MVKPWVLAGTIIGWPGGVPAVSRNFNVKCLNADELRAPTVLFLKEQMGNDYHMEATVEDKDDHANYVVSVPAVSFSLEPWTTDQHALVHMMDLKAFDIPLVISTFNQPLRLLSNSQPFLKMIPRGMCHEDADEHRQSAATPTPSSPLAESSQELPAQGCALLKVHHTCCPTPALHNSPLPPLSPPNDSQQSSPNTVHGESPELPYGRCWRKVGKWISP
ncbi:hypothetical protein EDC04DRAFT_2909775 [Pisolithus marmoratus]|nr:hypothetical protein EDC04DRAFT_2909775 [Pisolithus marmoratus]